MLIESAEAENFRNLSAGLECGSGLNIIFGDNGQGKTNWLEAIYLLATAKSFKTAKLIETVSFGANTAIVRCTVRRTKDLTRQLSVILEGNVKTLTTNNKKETTAGFLGQLHAILFNSDELEIIRGIPGARRKYLDTGIISIFPPYVQTLTDYKRVIKQKNSLLNRARDEEYPIEKLAELIEPWNEQLIQHAAVIYKARTRFVDRLNEVLEKRLFEREEVTIRYLSSLEGKGDLSDFKSLLEERLRLRLKAELYSGYSLIGIHRDDLEIAFDGHDLRKFGSSGQQRSALIILLLASLSVYYEQQQEYPVFLLDDIDSELDYKRIGRLLEYLEDKTQTFVTTSKESFVDKFASGARIHNVYQGQIRKSSAA